MYLWCQLFNDDSATSARFTRLDPRNRSHAPPCQVPSRASNPAPNSVVAREQLFNRGAPLGRDRYRAWLRVL